MKTVAIIGAGITGSMVAWYGQKLGLDVHVYEPDNNKTSCSYTAAGMLAPMAELERASDAVYKMGRRSLQLWPDILARLNGPVFYKNNGTLVVSHRQDRGTFNVFLNTLKEKLSNQFDSQCDVFERQTLEPELSHLGSSLWLKNEAQVDSHQALNALHQHLKSNAHWHTQKVGHITPYEVGDKKFDWVFDCRGLAAAKDIEGLHGVRGEVIEVHAPQVNINHMIRVMHPRYRIYIVPRENHHYLIGATEIQSDDNGPVSVRSCLELLSAAFSVHSGFAEARIIEMRSGVRPTALHHQPVIDHREGLTRINGLYRHGYLLAPAVAEKVWDVMAKTLKIPMNDSTKKIKEGLHEHSC
mgnify:CR=1 FL=1